MIVLHTGTPPVATEEASDHGHNREWHMVFTEEKLLDVEKSVA